MITIEQIFKTGALNGLHLSMSLNDVITLFGIPDDFPVFEFNEELLYQTEIGLDIPGSTLFYGCLELIFERITNKLVHINLMLDEQKQKDKTKYLLLPDGLKGSWIYSLSQMNKKSVIDYLDTIPVSWTNVYSDQETSMLQIKVNDDINSEVTIVIDLNSDNIYCILLTYPFESTLRTIYNDSHH